MCIAQKVNRNTVKIRTKALSSPHPEMSNAEIILLLEILTKLHIFTKEVMGQKQSCLILNSLLSIFQLIVLTSMPTNECIFISPQINDSGHKSMIF